MAIEQLDAEAEALLGNESAEWWAELNQSIDEARSDIAAGRGIPVTPELFEAITRKARVRFAAERTRRA